MFDTKHFPSTFSLYLTKVGQVDPATWERINSHVHLSQPHYPTTKSYALLIVRGALHV